MFLQQIRNFLWQCGSYISFRFDRWCESQDCWVWWTGGHVCWQTGNFYESKLLEDGQRLSDCGVGDFSTVDVFMKLQSNVIISSLTDPHFFKFVEAHPTDTVVDIKRNIQPLVGVACEQLHLINKYSGEVLNDEETLSSCNLCKGSIILFARRKPPLLTVKYGGGEVVSVVFSPSDSVQGLKADIGHKMGICPDRIRLLWWKTDGELGQFGTLWLYRVQWHKWLISKGIFMSHW